MQGGVCTSFMTSVPQAVVPVITGGVAAAAIPAAVLTPQHLPSPTSWQYQLSGLVMQSPQLVASTGQDSFQNLDPVQERKRFSAWATSAASVCWSTCLRRSVGPSPLLSCVQLVIFLTSTTLSILFRLQPLEQFLRSAEGS